MLRFRTCPSLGWNRAPDPTAHIKYKYGRGAARDVRATLRTAMRHRTTKQGTKKKIVDGYHSRLTDRCIIVERYRSTLHLHGERKRPFLKPWWEAQAMYERNIGVGRGSNQLRVTKQIEGNMMHIEERRKREKRIDWNNESRSPNGNAIKLARLRIALDKSDRDYGSDSDIKSWWRR